MRAIGPALVRRDAALRRAREVFVDQNDVHGSWFSGDVDHLRGGAGLGLGWADLAENAHGPHGSMVLMWGGQQARWVE